ncbi:NAD-binding protein [Mycobacterium sp. Aquia_216]|uniref:NAD-binding protein n=1 Tax=Mycobacterium sp. Aquia_216 TaxID=2991729 RepID=UPI003FA3D096
MKVGFIGAGRMGRPMEVCLDRALPTTMPSGSTLVIHATTSPTAADIGLLRRSCPARRPRGAGQIVKLVNNALFAGHIGLLAESIRLGERLGVPESTVLDALAHGSAGSRVLDIVAARGSIAGFIEVAGEFVGKDVAVVRSVAEDLGNDLGALDGVIEVLDVGGKV